MGKRSRRAAADTRPAGGGQTQWRRPQRVLVGRQFHDGGHVETQFAGHGRDGCAGQVGGDGPDVRRGMFAEVVVDGMVDFTRVKPLGRLGYHDYARLGEVFAMTRPSWP